MTKKAVEDVLLKGGAINPPRVRGVIEKWIEHKEDFNYKEDRGCIPVNVDRGVKECAYGDFSSFIGHKLKWDIDDQEKEEEYRQDIEDIFSSYWSNNEELRERFKEISYWCHEGSILINVKSAEEQGGIEGLLEKHGKEKLAKAAYEGRNYVDDGREDDDEDVDEQEEGQSSFGESEFPELHGIGVVDDGGKVVKSKLRGLVIAFSKDVNEIRGESREFDIKWAQRAFLYWGSEKFGDEWINFLVRDVERQGIYNAIKWVYNNNDQTNENFHKKYRGNYDLEVGNPSTDEMSKVFLDTEEPGWDDDGEDEEEQENKDRWDEWEEESKEIDYGDRKKGDNGDIDGDSGDSGGDADDVNASNSNGGEHSDSVDSPGSLSEWAEKQGTTDDIHKPSRTRAGKQSEVTETTQQSGTKDVQQRKTTTKVVEVECEDGGRPYPIQWPEVEPIDEFERNRIYEGNTFEWSLKLPENSVDTIVTSPPYYALRDYDIEDAFPISGDFSCDHDWEDEFCTKCGAFLGQLGHEPDPATFVEHIVDLMDRYKRVLKPSGSLWLNIGDTYAGKNMDGRVKAKRKSRMMIPERVYRRMVQTGWVLRDYVIWVKKIWMPDDDLRGNGKPFAGNSRLADQWEPMVRFTPRPDHYTDVDSNRLMPPSFDGDLGTKGIEGKFRKGEDTQRGKTYNRLGTNPPDVWLINSDGYDGDHRAVFPEELPKRCINLTTPDRVCEVCGRPYDKEVHVEEGTTLSPGGDYATYEPRCNCDAGYKPGVAFDPFLGSGTTAVAAANNGFDWAGVELSEKYAELARERIPTGRQVGLDQW